MEPVAHQEDARKAYRVMLFAGPPGYPTPVFDPADPVVCRTLQLRPSLWAVVFDTLQRLGDEYSWIQDDPSAATTADVVAEINKATDETVFAGCFMIGDVKTVARDPADFELLCDGSIYERVDYPDLYAVIDPAFIIDADTFAVPDLLDRFTLNGTGIGDSGGESSHVLTVAELPAHTHLYDNPTGTGLFVAPGEVPAVIAAVPSATSSTGGGDAMPIMPPYLTLLPVIVARQP